MGSDDRRWPIIIAGLLSAHVLACMEEHGIDAPALGISWDGTGYGADGTVWGGEFLEISESSFNRAGYFRYFPLPGGEKAIQEPRRAAFGVLHEIFQEKIFDIDPQFFSI